VPNSFEINFSAKEEQIFNSISTIKKGDNNISQQVEIKSEEPLLSLLKSFDNFQPKVSTKALSVFFSVPYLLASLVNLFIFAFIYFKLEIFVVLFAIASISLIGLALVFDMLLFFWVFELIAAFPGIKENSTGSAICLAILSLVSLGAFLILLFINKFRKS